MKFRRLRHPAHGGDFWQDVFQEARGIEGGESGVGVFPGQYRRQLIAYSLGADFSDEPGARFDGGGGRRLNREAEPRREANRPHHPQVVFAEPEIRLADRPDDSPLEVAPPAHIIEEPMVRYVVKHPVDGEIAPVRVAFFVGGTNRVGMSPVAVGAVFAELRHLELPVVHPHAHHAELRSHRDGFLEEALDGFGRRVRGDVPVLRGGAEQGVPHAPARQERAVA